MATPIKTLNTNPDPSPKRKPSLWEVLISVLGALVGVQSSRVQQRDFERGRPFWVYGLVWLGVVIIVVFGLAYLTDWLIRNK